LDALRSDPRFAFMFSGVLVADTMAEVLARLFRLPARGKPISVIDLSGVPAEVVTVVVSLLARLAFEQAMWARRNDREPILFVCEEAHRYVPASLEGGTASAGRMLGRIAKEGRKYGVSLGLITQRPSDLAPDILSQCGTLLSMRLSNDRDQSFVRAAMPEGGKSLLDAIPALRNRECIICGEGVRIPMRLMFEELADHHRPASDDPAIFQAWSSLEDRTALIHRTIQRWRGQ
jgi:DNA helicase HerA-like ATPase